MKTHNVIRVLIAEDPQSITGVMDALRQVSEQTGTQFQITFTANAAEALELLDEADLVIIDFYGERADVTRQAMKDKIPAVVSYVEDGDGALSDAPLIRCIRKPAPDLNKMRSDITDLASIIKRRRSLRAYSAAMAHSGCRN
jgi:CheY-like chemotaxis protein